MKLLRSIIRNKMIRFKKGPGQFCKNAMITFLQNKAGAVTFALYYMKGFSVGYLTPFGWL